MTNKANVTIIVPVYGDWPSLRECIKSLIINTNKDKHKVMLVNDCGPEVDLIEKNIKKQIKDFKNFNYFRNQNNLGFIGNCNNAVYNLDKSNNDVLLLNSDTKVTEGSIDELVNVMNSDRKIAALSPRSNNATLATIPISAARTKGINQEESYKIFQTIKDKLPRFKETPTAHGFCMLIRREVIKQYNLFDEVFGKGYGEEVDFCQRIRSNGYKCGLANKAYVYHLEARSFSLETKAKLLEQNNKIIWNRWPNYRSEVSQYMKQAMIYEASIEKQMGIKRVEIVSTRVNKVLKSLKRIVRKLFK